MSHSIASASLLIAVGLAVNVNAIADSYKSYTFTDLTFAPLAISSGGLILGQAADGSFFLDNNGVDTPLTGINFSPTGINDAGDIVGYRIVDNRLGAVSYSHGVISPINPPESVMANGINNAGQIVGGASHGLGFLYDHGAVTYLEPPVLEQGFWPHKISYASAINNLGWIVGAYGTFEIAHGFLYHDGAYTTIDFPDGFGETYLTGINDKNQIIGESYPGLGPGVGPADGFVLSNGVFTKLVYPASTTNLIELQTNLVGIDDAGDIIGGWSAAYEGTGPHGGGFIATPTQVPEPFSALLIGMGLLGAALGVRRARG